MDRRTDHELWEQEGEDALLAFHDARSRVNELLDLAANTSGDEQAAGVLLSRDSVADWKKRIADEKAARERWFRWLESDPR